MESDSDDSCQLMSIRNEKCTCNKIYYQIFGAFKWKFPIVVPCSWIHMDGDTLKCWFPVGHSPESCLETILRGSQPKERSFLWERVEGKRMGPKSSMS